MFNIERSFANLLYSKMIFEKRYSVKQLAPELDVSPSTLYDYVHGRLTFPPDKIPLLYKATDDEDFLKFFLEGTDLILIQMPDVKPVGRMIAIQGLGVMHLAGKVAGEIKNAVEDGHVDRAEAQPFSPCRPRSRPDGTFSHLPRQRSGTGSCERPRGSSLA